MRTAALALALALIGTTGVADVAHASPNYVPCSSISYHTVYGQMHYVGNSPDGWTPVHQYKVDNVSGANCGSSAGAEWVNNDGNNQHLCPYMSGQGRLDYCFDTGTIKGTFTKIPWSPWITDDNCSEAFVDNTTLDPYGPDWGVTC